MNKSQEPKFRVEHPKVVDGKWLTVYDKPDPFASPWRLPAELPIQHAIVNSRFEPKYTLYTEMIADMLAPLVDFQLEAWRERKSSESSSMIDLKMFDLVYESKGSTPQRVPWWGPSKLDLEKVFLRNSFYHNKVLHNYQRDPWMENTKKDRRYTNVWVAKESLAPFPKGIQAELKELVHIFGLPFYFYEPEKWDKPVGTDPFRMHLMVGVGRYLPAPEFWKTMSVMMDQGVIDANDFQQFAKALR